MTKALEGRVAIVTGAGSGLGRAYAHRMAAEGARVVVNDLSAASADTVCREINMAGFIAEPLSGDVADWKGAEQIVANAVERFGRLDILINNAGNLREATIVQLEEPDWDEVVRVHLKGHAAMLHWASRHWRARQKSGEAVRASVVNTTSNSGLFGQPGQAAYGAAKAAIAALTVVASVELGRYGVRVNSVSPAARTGMTDSVAPLRQLMRKPKSGFDLWSPENVAAAVSYLVSDTCGLTGQCWFVWGGCIKRLAPWSFAEGIESETTWTLEELKQAAPRLSSTQWVEPMSLVT